MNAQPNNRLDARSVRLDIDYLTRARYERARKHYGSITDAESTIGARSTDGDYITRDLFAGLLAPGSRVDPATDGTPVRRVLDWATEQLGHLPEWRALTNSARGNVITSALATEAIVDHLAALDWPARPEPTDDDAPSDMVSKNDGGLPLKIEWRIDGSTVETTRDRNGKRTKTSRTYGSPEAARSAVDRIKRDALRNGFSEVKVDPSQPPSADMLEAFADSLTNDPTAGVMFRGAAAGSVRNAAEEAKEVEDSLGVAYGLDGVEERTADPDETVLAMANNVRRSPDLAKFLRLIGSFMQSMKSSPNRQRVRGHVTPYDIEPTRDIRRLLPAELAMLGHAKTRDLATLRIMQGHALGWSFTEMGTKERGPMFVALDLSGSMQSRQTEAKAFAVAAALNAADNGRRVSIASFSTRVERVIDDLSTSDARAALINDMMQRRACGGTDFRPLVDYAETLDASTDVLLISDGCGAIDEHRTRETFKTRGLYYLVIGREDAVDPVLRDVAAGRMMNTDDITSGRAVEFAALATADR